MGKREDLLDSNGKFKKGNKGGGRPKGSKAKKTRDWEEMGEYIKGNLVPRYVDKIGELLDSGDPDNNLEGLRKIENILEYFQPKLSRTDVTSGGDKLETQQIFIGDLKGGKD